MENIENNSPIRVLVWDEAPVHAPKEVYPKSLNGAIADGLNELSGGSVVATCTNLDSPDQGITQDLLDNTDVLIWWGHARHGEVTDATAKLVIDQVLNKGLGFIPLHSAHYSKTMKGVLKCTGDLNGGWREATNPSDTEEITVCAPKHPIAQGIEDFVIPGEEMYGAPFDVPPAEVILFQSYFPLGGEYFPSFATTVGRGIDPTFSCGPGGGANRGQGISRVFYFRPGHETYPTYFNPVVRRIILNGVKWAAKRS